MVWKCPSCSYKSRSHQAVMKHYYAKHYKPKKGSTTIPKGKQSKTYTFKPLKRKKR